MTPVADLKTASTSSGLQAGKRPGYLNLLEPPSLIEAFLDQPPCNFAALTVGDDEHITPGFVAPFDILTTLDESEDWIKQAFDRVGLLKRMLTLPAVFVGTTVSEYSLFPPGPDFSWLISSLLRELKAQNAKLVIVKDIPFNSPLLSQAENQSALYLLSQLEEAQFQILSGQALAYVPIDFPSIDGFLASLSYTRRKEFRRKLKALSQLTVEEVPIGDKIFTDEALLQELYQLYTNVYEQSKIHFDRLTLPFFTSVLQNKQNQGIVFFYRRDRRIIGYNICFIHQGNLVDKYVGFAYPDAREANLYFVSWFYNLEYALRNKLRNYIAGWTDPEVKASLGARFTFTKHAVYLRNPLLRFLLSKIRHIFESDQNWANSEARALATRLALQLGDFKQEIGEAPP